MKILLALILLLPLSLSGCSNCIDSGICPIANEGPKKPKDPLLTFTAPRQSNTDLSIHLDLNGISATTALEFVPSPSLANSIDPSILATADNGHVVVRRLAQTFVGPKTKVNLIVSKDTTITANVLFDLSFRVRQAGSNGVPGIISLFVKVQ